MYAVPESNAKANLHTLSDAHCTSYTPNPRPLHRQRWGPEAWSQTEHWYRDQFYEQSLALVMEFQAQWIDASDIRLAALAALSGSADRDLSLSLGCLGQLRMSYLSTYH